jgi:hypothetical protein
MLETLQAGSPLALVIPTFTDPDWAAQLGQLVKWLFAAAVGLLILVVAGARWPALGGWRLAVISAAAFALSGAAIAAHPSSEIRQATARRGATELLWNLDERRVRLLAYDPIRPLARNELRQFGTIVLPARPDGAARDTYTTSPVALPAGAYEAVVTLPGDRRSSTEISVVATSSKATFGRATNNAPTTRVPFELPVGVGRLSVRVSGLAGESAVDDVQIVPIAVVARRDREDVAIRAVESIEGSHGGYIAYADEHAYPEGGVFWTRGTEEARFLVAPQGSRRIVLTLFTGPNAGQVVVREGGQVHTALLRAGEAAEMRFDVGVGQRLVDFAVQSPVMFRPADVDKASTDARRLGCQVRVRLE